MFSFIIRLIINATILILISFVFPSGIMFDNFYAALITALVLGMVNTLIKPLIVILTLPINILTLGLLTLFINGALFWLVSTFVKGFYVSGFWAAFWAALIYTIISAIISWVDYLISSSKN